MAKAYGYPTAIEHFQLNKSQWEKKQQQQQQKIEEGNQGGAERCLVGVAPALPVEKAAELSAEGVAHPVIHQEKCHNMTSRSTHNRQKPETTRIVHQQANWHIIVQWTVSKARERSNNTAARVTGERGIFHRHTGCHFMKSRNK